MDYIPSPYDAAQEEPLFENSHTREKQFFQEFFRYYCFFRPTWIVLWCISSLYLIFGIISCFGGEPYWFSIFLLPCIITLQLFSYFLNVRTSVARQQEGNQSAPISYTVEIFQDKICIKTSLGTVQAYSFADIKSLFSTKHYLFLNTRARQAIPLEKDKFTKGNYQELCAFLKQKGYKVKGK